MTLFACQLKPKVFDDMKFVSPDKPEIRFRNDCFSTVEIGSISSTM